MAPHSSTFAWKIPWTEEPGRLQSTESLGWLSDFTFTFHFHGLEKEMAIHSSVLAWRIPGMGAPCGLPSMGSHRVGHDWSDLAAAAAGQRKRVFKRPSRHLNPCVTLASHMLFPWCGPHAFSHPHVIVDSFLLNYHSLQSTPHCTFSQLIPLDFHLNSLDFWN